MTQLPRPLHGFLAAMLFAATLANSAANAGWTLDGEPSVVSFVSVKNGTTAEAHKFEELEGSVSHDGARLEVQLASVETLIPIRNDRMRELLFEIASFPEAVFETDLDASALDEIPPGQSKRISVEGTLRLHGESAPVSSELLVSRMQLDRVVVTTVKPIVISADTFGLGDGIDKLREIAGLNAITPMVPVSLSLVFVEDF